MAKDYLNEYRKEIRKSYEEEKKNGNHANFLVNPSPANLRELCVNIFRDNKNTDDFVSFRYYFGFDYTIENVNELNLQNNLNKFVPIGRFLKGESELKSIHGLDLVAMLVNFKNRPFNKFKNLNIDEVEVEKEEDDLLLFQPEKLKENNTKRDEEGTDALSEPSMILAFANTNDNERINKHNKKSKLKYVAIAFLILVVGFFGTNYFLNQNKCMQWQGNHYEKVDCEVKGFASFYKVEPIDAHQFKLQRVNVTDTTVCFRGKEPIVFYSKMNGKMEYFNQMGKHPESGQILKPLSPHMYAKYIAKTKK